WGALTSQECLEVVVGVGVDQLLALLYLPRGAITQIGVDVDGPPEMGNGLVRLPLGQKGQSEVVVRASILGVDLGSLPVAADRSFQISLVLQRNSQVVVCPGHRRFDADRGPVTADGLIHSPVTVECKSEVVVGLGVLG